MSGCGDGCGMGVEMGVEMGEWVCVCGVCDCACGDVNVWRCECVNVNVSM